MRCGKMRCGAIRRCGGPKHIPVEGIEISESSIEINVGESFQLSARVLPHNASNQNILWSSSDESIATVEDGLVTAVDLGHCVVTATSEEGDYTATCEVIVYRTK